MTPTGEAQSHARESAIDIGVDRAHSARVFDALCGGRTNFTADREVAWRIRQVMPLATIALAAARLFVHRAARHLAAAGLYQFLDLGAGLPQIRSLHEILQPVGADTRVVYVDHDPIVIAHLQALLSTEPCDGGGVLHADVTEPERLLSAIAEQGVVDLTRPVVVVMAALLDHLPPDAEPARILEALAAHMAPGSALVLTLAAADLNDDAARAAEMCRDAGIEVRQYSRSEAESLFAGWDLLPPGVIPASRWRSGGHYEPDVSAPVYAGVAVLPRRPHESAAALPHQPEAGSS